MKKLSPILICTLVFSCFSAFSQNRSSNDDTDYRKEQRKEQMEKNKEKYVEDTVENLKTELELDALQYVAIKQILTESVRLQGIILKKEETNEEDKVKAMNALTETTETKVKALLNKPQIEKYDALKENMLTNKGSKKKKKKT